MSRPAMVDCPSCGGYGYTGHDESGAPYACYHCGTTGQITAAALAEERRAEAWHYFTQAEHAIRRRIELGVPHGWSFRFDEYDGIVLIPPPAERAAAAQRRAELPEFDDIPF